MTIPILQLRGLRDQAVMGTHRASRWSQTMSPHWPCADPWGDCISNLGSSPACPPLRVSPPLPSDLVCPPRVLCSRAPVTLLPPLLRSGHCALSRAPYCTSSQKAAAQLAPCKTFPTVPPHPSLPLCSHGVWLWNVLNHIMCLFSRNLSSLGVCSVFKKIISLVLEWF